MNHSNQTELSEPGSRPGPSAATVTFSVFSLERGPLRRETARKAGGWQRVRSPGCGRRSGSRSPGAGSGEGRSCKARARSWQRLSSANWTRERTAAPSSGFLLKNERSLTLLCPRDGHPHRAVPEVGGLGLLAPDGRPLGAAAAGLGPDRRAGAGPDPGLLPVESLVAMETAGPSMTRPSFPGGRLLWPQGAPGGARWARPGCGLGLLLRTRGSRTRFSDGRWEPRPGTGPSGLFPTCQVPEAGLCQCVSSPLSSLLVCHMGVRVCLHVVVRIQ